METPDHASLVLPEPLPRLLYLLPSISDALEACDEPSNLWDTATLELTGLCT